MQRLPSPAVLQALRAFQAASICTDGLYYRLYHQFQRGNRPSNSAAVPGQLNLGQLCKKFQESAGKNNAAQAERWHEKYLQQGGQPKVWMMNTLIGVYARRRDLDRAFAIYQDLLAKEQSGGEHTLAPNLFTYTNLLNVLSKAQHPPYDLGLEAAERAVALFEEMRARGIHPNQVAFHSLMDVQAKAALPDAAFATFRDMLAAGVPPSHTTFSILMTACGRAGEHRRAVEVMEKLMPQAGVAPTTALWNSLLGAFAKSGSVDGAYATWVRMLESGSVPDAYTERALVDALSSHPALAADVLAEARQIRQGMAQHAQQQQQAKGGGTGTHSRGVLGQQGGSMHVRAPAQRALTWRAPPGTV